MNRVNLVRILLAGLLMPFLYFGGAGAAFLYRLHSGNGERANVLLPPMTSVAGSDRILVFAPHPDDEMLGCAGLIQQSLKAGAQVRIVFLTNGDGFRVAVERQYRKMRLDPQDYMRFADFRQEEALRALAALGVREDQVRFLGYPDRGLMKLWNDHWSPANPFTSRYTGVSRSPYRRTAAPGAIYSGQSFLHDVRRMLRELRPTRVFVTHPSDDHADHSAASAFVTLALTQLREENAAWARDATLEYYLIHRGDWPVPQGRHPEDVLVPPAEMVRADTRWQTLRLLPEEVDKKEQGILKYESQTAVMKRFLLSFARSSELFGAEPDRDAARVRTAESAASRRIPVIRDPVNDNLLRDFQAAGDIKAVFAARSAEQLDLRIQTARPPSASIRYLLRIRCFGGSGSEERDASLIQVLKPRDGETELNVSIPFCELGNARKLALCVETSFAGLTVDSTGFRFLSL